MAYLIDSDVVIDHLVDDPAALRLLDRLASLEHEMILVTRNLADYEDIPDLVLYAPR